MADNEPGAALGTWQALVRRTRLRPELKLAALVLASYASADGQDIRPGVGRFAVDCGDLAYSTARRYLAELRDLGLLQLVRRGNRRATGGRTTADVYRLAIPDDLLARLKAAEIDLPDPDEYTAMARRLQENNRLTQRANRERKRTVQHSPDVDTSALDMSAVMSADTAISARGGSADVDTSALDMSAEVSADAAISAHPDGYQRSRPRSDLRPPNKNHLPNELPTSQLDDGLRTEVTVPPQPREQAQASITETIAAAQARHHGGADERDAAMPTPASAA